MQQLLNAPRQVLARHSARNHPALLLLLLLQEPWLQKQQQPGTAMLQMPLAGGYCSVRTVYQGVGVSYCSSGCN
jgi:hypothetical protein